MLTSRGGAGGARILPGFSALSARRSHRRVLKPAGNKCKDNEGVVRASTAGIRPADKAPVFLAAVDTTERQCGSVVDAHGA